MRVQGSRLRPVLPGSCQGVGKPEVTRAGEGILARWEITCPGGLMGKTLGVEGIATSRADVLLRVALADSARSAACSTPDQPSFLVPGAESRAGVVHGYARLGVEHILTGWDHLLFVLGLVLLVGPGRILLWTITAFTVGHSVTLALAALGMVRVPQGPMEAAIALSIYLLAVELIRNRAGRITFVQRAPWLVAGGFGLLHGLGFAGALAEVGLPQGEIPLALFAFNLGIELGQLAFVGRRPRRNCAPEEAPGSLATLGAGGAGLRDRLPGRLLVHRAASRQQLSLRARGVGCDILGEDEPVRAGHVSNKPGGRRNERAAAPNVVDPGRPRAEGDGPSANGRLRQEGQAQPDGLSESGTG